MLTREQLHTECRKIFDALPDRGETIDGVDDAVLKLNKQAAMAIDLEAENGRLKAALKIEDETREMANPVINSYVGDLKDTVSELTAIVEAYRLAGKWAELGTNCHDCPVRLGTCGNNKKPACQHPSDYEAEWIKAVRGE